MWSAASPSVLLAALTLAAAGAAQEPDAAPPTWPEIELLPRLVEEHGLGAAYREFVARQDGFVQAFRLRGLTTHTRRIFQDPLSAPRFAVETSDRLAGHAFAGDASLDALLADAGWLLDEELREATGEDVLAADLGWRARLDRAQERLERAAALVDEAFTAGHVTDREALRARLIALLTTFKQNVYPTLDAAHAKTLDDLRSVRTELLLQAARTLAPLADPRFVELVHADMRRDPPDRSEWARGLPGVEGIVLHHRTTKAGSLLVGGVRRNVYDAPAALILDLGGNDVYGARATRSDWNAPLNLVLDREGDDHYRATELGSQGCGLLGVSFLVDHAGDDRYEAGEVAQGCGVLGIGVLLDASGTDHYRGDAYVQGAGCLGIGILWERDGNDTLEAHLDAQGFGWPRSVGLLLDARGDDVRTATGGYPSSYGTAGEYSAHSQGAAFGFRTLTWTHLHLAGGFGILIDGAGNDRSTVGEFGFGIGYFFGFGLVRDLGGDDQVDAARYGIATGAHNGIGIVLDDAGNDRFANPHTASLAGNWDLNLSFFVDRAGDDRYHGAGITLGSSTITSLAAFVDGGGKDVYAASGGQCFGSCGHPEDFQRETRCLAFFVDLGGASDEYPADSPLDPRPANDLVAVRRQEHEQDGRRRETGVGVFVDR